MPNRIVEPHLPAATGSRRYTGFTGRGGAGNLSPSQNSPSSSRSSSNSPSSNRSSSRQSSQQSYSGRGGAGNLHTCSEFAIFSFDEELEIELRRAKDVAPVFHVGRGGAANVIFDDSLNFLRKPSTINSVGSSSSSDSNHGKSQWASKTVDPWRPTINRSSS